ncbi:UspA domain protein [Natrialba magadii ATCC 43099]|uniref:UspA domain protein n=1 Tax=Natrialba magadii (strain ATCC 43099 / DSM 3394 / CCM 3739 / CIP 104546 / IAM 13178 / JCM 8861 / NBRC 102185 / NCIMB 2190 / MS3) TaxID=547559 RepID=D3SW87_NATMM|nr:universal stress protein [Natrialba magadii]ADD05748.1 UspA domain protein [Natrialba magadii ATCC 43099]ELY29839.1 UspA domain-containing protein [Natrialba magadii ATCC 43099]
MTEHILVPVDGSQPATAALEYAHERFPENRLTVLYVVDPMADYSRERSYPGYTADDEFKTEHEKGEAVLERVRERLPDDATVETALEAGKPSRVIVEYADDHDIDGIVIGSHGRSGAVRYLLGSVAEQVVRRAAVPVTIVRGSPDDEPSD